MKRFLIAILLSTLVSPLFAEIIQEVGVDFRPSYVFSSYKDELLKQNFSDSFERTTHFSLPIHLKWGFTYPEGSKQDIYIPGAWQGVGVGVNLFFSQKYRNPWDCPGDQMCPFGSPDSNGIGNPALLYLYQGAPVWNITSRLSLYYEWNFGLSMGWRPCGDHSVSSNLIVGSKVNAYINLGSGLRWDLGKGYHLTAGVDLTHFSNGNTAYPNPGVNMAGVRVGVTKSFGTSSKDNRSSVSDALTASGMDALSADSLSGRSRLGWDVTLYGAWRKRVYRGNDTPVLLSGSFGIAGVSVSPMWEVARIFRAGVSADFQWDESSNLKKYYVSGNVTEDMCFYRPPFFSQVSGGLSARAELVMPLFSVNLGIGYNVFGPSESRASYQLANLKIRVVKGLFVNIGYQLLDFSRQNNLMLGLGYSFRH